MGVEGRHVWGLRRFKSEASPPSASSNSSIVAIMLLCFVCVMIALQVTWLISAIARIHDISTTQNRALSASVNSMAGRLLTAVCLIMSKFILDGNSMQFNLLIFLLLFLPSAYILKRFNKVNEND